MRDHGEQLSRGATGCSAIRALLAQVGLPPQVADMYPHELSGGMKQRACIAIAICLRPKVIIADEPTSALDVVVQRQVMETLGRVQAELGAAVILVGHDMGLMAQFVDRLGIMYAGRLVEVAPIRDIITAPRHPYTRHADRKPAVAGAQGRSARHSRPGAAAARAAVGLRLPSALSDGAGSAAWPKSLRCARWVRMQPRRAISHDRAASNCADVSKSFAGGVLGRERKVALETFSFAIDPERPGITAVVGESGSGKTTLARLLLGLVEPTEGQVLYHGRDLRALSAPNGANSAARCRRSSRTRTRSTTRSTGSTTC